jgi:hypothetical protein
VTESRIVGEPSFRGFLAAATRTSGQQIRVRQRVFFHKSQGSLPPDVYLITDQHKPTNSQCLHARDSEVALWDA